MTARPTVKAARKQLARKAWAIVNDETGRLTQIHVGGENIFGPTHMESPAIYMTKVAAEHHKRDDERIVRVEIREVP